MFKLYKVQANRNIKKYENGHIFHNCERQDSFGKQQISQRESQVKRN